MFHDSDLDLAQPVSAFRAYIGGANKVLHFGTSLTNQPLVSSDTN